MNTDVFEQQLEAFWDGCDTWVEERSRMIAAGGGSVSDSTLQAIQQKIEEDLNDLIAQGIHAHASDFSPDILIDLHHLFFELALQEHGEDNQDMIHRYKDNGQVAIAVLEGKMNPENAKLVMEINRAHLEKKGADPDAPCDDCVCGRK